jgi:transcriptional accessory protein Tex/SPT6
MSDLVWQKIFDLEKKAEYLLKLERKVEYLLKLQQEQEKINANLIKLLKGLEEKK